MAEEPLPDFCDLVDLAAERLGGAAIACNDEFFAEKDNLLREHAAVWKDHEYTDRGKWMDGWESRRRRAPQPATPWDPGGDRDWCIVRLGLPGVIRGVIVDTAFFRGNFPAECSLEAAASDGPAAWTEILPRSALRGDSKNEFEIAGARVISRGCRPRSSSPRSTTRCATRARRTRAVSPRRACPSR